ncbi:MAG TPA: sulfite exporter TauE/SafE family protein, partial [Candidatus Binatia bacterium]|nr:sulfite exporter TauE/SafE family protein [Candidatus Binatia bacterium]
GSITLLVLAMMLLPAPAKSQDNRSTAQVSLPALPLSIFSTLTGGIVGLLGSGNFIFPPLLIYILKVPTRIAIGSSPIIALINSSAGFLGKLFTGQIPFLVTFVVVIGAALGALGGERVHRRLSSATLRRIYAVLVILIAVRVWLTLLA